MLYFSLVVSGVLVIAAWWAARHALSPVGATLSWAAGVALFSLLILSVAPMLFMSLVAFPALWWQAGLLFGGVLIAAEAGCGRQAIRPLALFTFVIPYAVVGWSAYGRYDAEKREYDRLRAEYPLESLDARLPRLPAKVAGGDSERLDRLEKALDRETDYHRMRLLRGLHEGTVTRFAATMDFGVARMSRMDMTAKELEAGARDDAPPQADYFRPELRDADRELTRPELLALGRFHEDGILDFVNPRGFGYVNDRRHVAGFRPHAFTKTPGPVEKWEVARLELVGLLLHENPVVYESAKLPRMDELRDAPTRPLDEFEARALAALRAGADLHTRDGQDGLRFVGAIRSTKQCLECHGGKRGALLGAFSYRLRPAK